MPNPLYSVDAYSEWPNGSTDAVYDIVENVEKSTDGVNSTADEILRAVARVLKSKQASDFINDHQVQMHIVISAPQSALPKRRRR